MPSFSALKVFKLGSADAAPPPPPKDVASLYPPRSLFTRSAASLVPSLSPDSISGPATPATPYLPFAPDFAKRQNGRTPTDSPAPSASSLRSLARAGVDLLTPSMDGSTDSSGSCPNAHMYLINGANSSAYTVAHPADAAVKPKKNVFRLANLAKRNRSKKDLSDAASTSGSVTRSVSVSEQDDSPDGDEGISMPWNFQHNIHVDEGYIGLPPSWSSALSQVGFNHDEIAAIHARRRAAATGTVPDTNQATPLTPYSNEWPLSPPMAFPSTSTSSPTLLLQPVPRSTSLRKGRDHPPSLYSIAVGSTIGGPSPALSPRAPSFSMKSFVSGIKNSLTSDSASVNEGGSSRDEGATREESDQYVFVDGDGPAEGTDHGMGDETFIEPYPYDTSSISSHQTHASRVPRISQEQQTPRTPSFPQIQVQRSNSDTGYVPHHSSAPQAPSPLVHSTSLPIPTPPRGYTYSTSPSPSHSLASAGSPPGPASAPPRTASRRIYHIANASSDSYDGTNYTEPPPAYVSPEKGDWIPKKEKDGSGVSANQPPPNRPVPPLPAQDGVGEPSGASNQDGGEEDQEVSTSTLDTTASSVDNIPRTADEVLDISSHYSDNATHDEDAEVDPALRAISPTPPLVIDKRVSKLATLPPRISFHQEGDLEDWSQSLFSAIGGKKRSSILMSGNGASSKERRSTLRPMSLLTSIGAEASAMASSPEALAPTLPDVSFRADLTLGPHARGNTEAVEEEDEQEQAGEETPEDEQAADVDVTATAAGVKQVDGPPAAPSTPVLPDVSLGPNVSSIGKDLELPASTPPIPSESPRRVSIESLPPSPPPKPKSKSKPKPTPLAMPPAATLAPPRTNIITGISGRSPVNSLFGQKPQPLPIPIPPSQIRAQLRPAPPKSPHPPPTLPLPPLKRISSLPNSSIPPPKSQSPLPPIPSPPKALKLDPTVSRASPSGSRHDSSQTPHPVRVNPDRDSDLSTITVTPATIATAKTEVVRTAIASVILSDTFSVTSRRESTVSTVETEQQTLAHDRVIESPRPQECKEVPDIYETSSAALLRNGSQSKWPTPPPPPVELETDSTPRRVSRFRTTSLGRVSQLQAMNAAATSPISSHSSHGSSDTVSSSTSESAPLTTPKGINGVPSAVPKTKGGLAVEARLLSSAMDTFGGVDVEVENSDEIEVQSQPTETPSLDTPAPTLHSVHPLLAQLQPYISPRDPASCFTNLVEIAEGESGFVFAARVAPSSPSHKDNSERPIPSGTSHVAIKRIPLPPIASSPSLSDDAPISNKLVSVLHELVVLKNLEHEHLLLPDAIYVSKTHSYSNLADESESVPARAVDTSLWIRMELMERSLADVIGLVAEGLALQERLIARFASDVLNGLDYLQRQHIAHRDVRSDNLLVNASGVVKLADFSNAIRVDRNSPVVSGAVGVIYWQAPEMRTGPYNALKVDVWSLGATVWELAETVPPFSCPASPSTQVSFTIQTARHLGSQWPRLTHPDYYSRTFHEFLKLCGRESAGRPGPGELLNTPFIRNACGRAVILQLLSQCRAIEETIAAKETSP